jgi:hypothetical protein
MTYRGCPGHIGLGARGFLCLPPPDVFGASRVMQHDASESLLAEGEDGDDQRCQRQGDAEEHACRHDLSGRDRAEDLVGRRQHAAARPRRHDARPRCRRRAVDGRREVGRQARPRRSCVRRLADGRIPHVRRMTERPIARRRRRVRRRWIAVRRAALGPEALRRRRWREALRLHLRLDLGLLREQLLLLRVLLLGQHLRLQLLLVMQCLLLVAMERLLRWPGMLRRRELRRWLRVLGLGRRLRLRAHRARTIRRAPGLRSRGLLRRRLLDRRRRWRCLRQPRLLDALDRRRARKLLRTAEAWRRRRRQRCP